MATDQVLEATARAITYYLDVSQECTRRIVACDGTIRAICSRLLVIEVDNKTSKDLAEQCIKSLELLCARESSAVFEAGGLTCILPFILEHGSVIHKDTLHSAMSVVTRLCGKMEPNCDQQSLDFCVETLSKLLVHEDAFVADGALRCFVSLSDRFIRKGTDPTVLAKYGLIEELLKKLNESINLNTNVYSVMPVSNNNDTLNGKTAQQLLTAPTLMGNLSTDLNKSLSASSSSSSNSAISITMLTSLLSTLCRSSDAIFKEIVKPNSTLLESVEKVCSCGLDERCVLDIIRFLELLLTLIYEGRQALTAKTGNSASIKQEFSKNSTNANQVSETDEKVRWDKLHRHLIELIRIKDTESFIDSLESSITSFTSIDVINFMDDVGQTLLNWAAAFGKQFRVSYL
jgi:E3 ubiquitin-protein ligase HECTD1